MSFKVNQIFHTTTARNIARAAVSGAVGALVSWGTVKWADLNSSSLSYLVPTISSAYFAAVHMLEISYPKAGWLLGLLPQRKLVVGKVTVPEPLKENDPVAKKAPVKKATAAKKAAPVKKAAPKTTGK
jgi:hypothetical protein